MPIDRGYYRNPTISGDRIVFVSEDDLWVVSAGGGPARRLTSGEGRADLPRFGPGGGLIAYSATEEGHQEVYVMDARGGPAKRLTFLGDTAKVTGWTPDGDVVFVSSAGRPFFRDSWLHRVAPEGGAPQTIPWGPAGAAAWGPDGAAALSRHFIEPAWWKRYRGGRAGVIWVDVAGDGEFVCLELPGQQAWPMWLAGRLWFLSDHEGVGNLYSCAPAPDAPGADLRRETEHGDFYVRAPDTDGERIVYAAGAELYALTPGAGSERVRVDYRSPRTWRRRRFKAPERYLESVALHPAGHSLALTTRGRVFVMGNWEGPAVQLGERDGVRYRLAKYLPDGARIVCVSDRGGEEGLEIFSLDGATPPERLEDPSLGGVLALSPAPSGSLVAWANHRYEVGLIDLETGACRVVDRSPFGRCGDLAWSADGRWLAWSRPSSDNGAAIWLLDTRSDETTQVTSGRYRDRAPSFDPDGGFLAFLSHREFRPVYDSLQFELGFPRGMRPYVVTLRADSPSPFQQSPRELVAKKKKRPDTPQEVKIDLRGIGDRLVPVPVSEGRYGQLACVPGKILFTQLPVQSGRPDWRSHREPAANATLLCWDLQEGRQTTLTTRITDFRLDAARKTLAYRAGWKLRVIRAGLEPPKPNAARPDPKKKGFANKPGRKSGWVDLRRISVSVTPAAEWTQMFQEAWRLMREHFWTPDMSGVDWGACRARYAPLLERVGSRSEFSDLVWELYGELGTSHAYEMGGDYRAPPRYRVGKLAADARFDPEAGAWRIEGIARGEPGDLRRSSPLTRPGVNLSPGDRLLAINGQPAGPDRSLGELLIHSVGREVLLTAAAAGGGEPRQIRVKPLGDERPARYRDWVIRNRERVLRESGGRVGYVHVPDMGADGFAAFHRDYFEEVRRQALIVDVRFNRGGHVSQLLFQKLVRRRLGYNISRWGVPTSYPRAAPLGPMVCLTNEMAGSDGDIFSHAFKMQGLGELIGTRTWGGVVGIWPRHKLVDGGVVTQPEFSFWFHDAGWGVENHGADPDVVIPFCPQDHAAGRDPQLDEGLRRILAKLEADPPALPAFEGRPRLAPRWPPEE